MGGSKIRPRGIIREYHCWAEDWHCGFSPSQLNQLSPRNSWLPLYIDQCRGLWSLCTGPHEQVCLQTSWVHRILKKTFDLYKHRLFYWHEPNKIIDNYLLYNERSSADSLFRKGNAQLYLFTLNSTHLSLCPMCNFQSYWRELSDKTRTDGWTDREWAVLSFARLWTAFAKQ